MGSSAESLQAKDHINIVAEHKQPMMSGQRESISSNPPAYRSVIGEADIEMEKLLGADADCNCQLEFYYKIDDKEPGTHISDSTPPRLQLARGTLLTLLARCRNEHRITKFNHALFNDCEEFGYGISLVIAQGDEGAYLLGAQCAGRGQDMVTIYIQITDVTGNPEHTEPKYVPDGTLDSLDSTVTEPSLNVVSESSKPLEAMPKSLSSNPSLVDLARDLTGLDDHKVMNKMDDDLGPNCKTHQSLRKRPSQDLRRRRSSKEDESSEGAGSGSVTGHGGDSDVATVSMVSGATEMAENLQDTNNGCTLPLVTLTTDRSLKKTFDDLCTLLEPVTSRPPALTIVGLVYKTLGYSMPKIEHIVWAKQPDLRNSPARVMLMMMVQDGKRASDVVAYFSQRPHRHVEIMQNLKDIPSHQNCPVCHKFS